MSLSLCYKQYDVKHCKHRNIVTVRYASANLEITVVRACQRDYSFSATWLNCFCWVGIINWGSACSYFRCKCSYFFGKNEARVLINTHTYAYFGFYSIYTTKNMQNYWTNYDALLHTNYILVSDVTRRFFFKNIKIWQPCTHICIFCILHDNSKTMQPDLTRFHII